MQELPKDIFPGHRPPLTSLKRALRLGAMLGLPRLYLKMEGDNPTGTHKDRMAAAVAAEALERGFSGLTAGTCGNYGISLARQARDMAMKCLLCVPEAFGGGRLPEALQLGAEVLRVGSNYEEAVEASSFLAAGEGLYDANPRGAAAETAMEACAAIAEEICLELHGCPGSAWVAVGNGTTLGSLYRGFLRSGSLPRLGGAGSLGNTAAITSALRGKEVLLDPRSLHPTEVNEPLVNWRSLQSDLVVEAIGVSGGLACEVTDGEMLAWRDLLGRLEGAACLPAAAAALAGLARFAGNLAPGEDHVVILTG